MSTTELHYGDCLDVLRRMDSACVHAIVTDPPYGLSFMGKKWDYDVPSTEIWEQCLRVLKPGGYLLAFAGTRTQHRMCVNIEDAGFEIRDMIAWVYGEGFPKGKTCLKPALEPITMARKPAKHVQPLNIDGCRVGDDTGRWPANLLHDGSDEVTQLFPESKPSGSAMAGKPTSRKASGVHNAYSHALNAPKDTVYHSDSGSAARFFYCPKANKKDRDNGNTHPTVKPTDLMAYLCRLVTPSGGIVLDPFMGSGSTGKAAISEGFGFIGIERDADYYDICQSRINGAQLGLALAL